MYGGNWKGQWQLTEQCGVSSRENRWLRQERSKEQILLSLPFYGVSRIAIHEAWVRERERRLLLLGNRTNKPLGKKVITLSDGAPKLQLPTFCNMWVETLQYRHRPGALKSKFTNGWYIQCYYGVINVDGGK